MSESIKARSKRLWDMFKLTIAQWAKLYYGQNAKCGICGCGIVEVTVYDDLGEVAARRPATDHDWISGEVRGLLCGRCNTILGKIERGNRGSKPWTLDELKAAVAYKENPPARRIFGESHFGWPGDVTTKKHRKMLRKLAKEKQIENREKTQTPINSETSH